MTSSPLTIICARIQQRWLESGWTIAANIQTALKDRVHSLLNLFLRLALLQPQMGSRSGAGPIIQLMICNNTEETGGNRKKKPFLFSSLHVSTSGLSPTSSSITRLHPLAGKKTQFLVLKTTGSKQTDALRHTQAFMEHKVGRMRPTSLLNLTSRHPTFPTASSLRESRLRLWSTFYCRDEITLVKISMQIAQLHHEHTSSPLIAPTLRIQAW